MRSSLRAGVCLSIAMGCNVGCSSGAPPWPSENSDVAGASGQSALGDGSGAGGSSGGGAAGARAMASAGATASTGSSDAGPEGPNGSGAAGQNGSSASEGPSVGAPPVTPPGQDPGNPLPEPQLCQQLLRAVNELPTVVVVVDRTGSMFNPVTEAGATAWSELRTTLLAAIDALDGEARFGFLAYSGDFELCPELTALPPGLDNHAAIAALYGSLELALRRNGGPVGALNEAASLLSRAGGDPHVWLVTDGDVDYCDDGNPLCPVDSAIASVQRLAAATPPIRTSVFGPTTTLSVLATSALQSLANAGAGEPVARPATGPVSTDVNAIFDQCSAVPDWASDFASTGKPIVRGQSVADYAESGGAAVVHLPVGSDVAGLVAELRSRFVVERRCAFDLAADGVTESALATIDASAVLELGGAPVAHDEQNGWHVVGGSTLRLEGAACDAVRAAAQVSELELRWSCTP